MTARQRVRARLIDATEHRVAVGVEGPEGSKELDLSSPDPVWQAPPPNLDFAAVALCQYAAAAGCDLVLEGQATRAQLDRLEEFLMIWSVWRPDLFRPVAVCAEEEVDPDPPAGRGGAVMGFSGGVDASFALAAHRTGALGRLSRDISLGVMVVDRSLRRGGDTALERASCSARRSLDTYGVELAVVRSNWQEDFCSAWFMGFNTGYMSLLHTFSGTHSAAIHATDRTYLEELHALPYGSHMVINHLLGHHAFPVVSTGGTHARTERIAFLADHPVLLSGLRVCYQDHADGANCGHCEKCVRTQLEMRVVGLPTTEVFPSPFTLDDIQAMDVRRWPVLSYFDAILDRLDPEDEAYDTLRRWLRGQRDKWNPETRRLRGRIRHVGRELASARSEADALREELAALRASTSWQLTRPLRTAGGALREIRS
jgi:hypothetical protein